MKNNFLKGLIIFLTFLVLFFIQEGIFSRFTLFGFGLNIYLLFLFLILFFSQEEKTAFSFSILGGLILDFFSLLPFGIFSLTLFLSYLFFKKISLFFKKTNTLNFLALLILFFLFYNIIFRLLNYLFNLIL